MSRFYVDILRQDDEIDAGQANGVGKSAIVKITIYRLPSHPHLQRPWTTFNSSKDALGSLSSNRQSRLDPLSPFYPVPLHFPLTKLSRQP